MANYDKLATLHTINDDGMPIDIEVRLGFDYSQYGFRISNAGLVHLDKRVDIARFKSRQNNDYCVVHKGDFKGIILPTPRLPESRIEFINPDKKEISITKVSNS